VSRWPNVVLGEALSKSDDWIQLDPEREYKEVTVRNRGQGAVLRRVVTGAEIASTRRMRAHYRQFIVSRIDARHGSSGVIPAGLEGAIVTNDFPIFDCHQDVLLPEYLGWYSKTPQFVDECRHASEGSTNRIRLKEAAFLEIAVPLPPLEEQRRVVEKLNRLADRAAMLRTAQLRADVDLLALRRVLYANAEQDALRRGAWVSLSRLIASHDSGWSPRCEDDPASPGTWGVLKTTCVQWDGFRAGANKALRPALAPRPELAVRKGDILITRAGPVNRVGVACVVPEDHACLMLSDKIVRMVPAPHVDPDFIAAMIGAPGAQEYLRQSKTGLAASQVNISRARLLALEVPLPALHEQRRLVKALLHSLSALDRCTRKRQEGTPVVAAFERAMLRVVFD